jgi:nucleoside-diphosphate-sugar epimerase
MTRKKRILITGGLGFIGRNLFNALLQDDYDVTVLTGRIYDNSGLSEEAKTRIILGNILDKPFVEETIRNYDVIFSLAGSSGASDSVKNPYHDLDTNLKGHLNILEACRKNNPDAVLVFPSSRLVYGKPQANPVNENHPIQPESIYAIHKLTTEHYYLLYQRLHGVKCIIFRVSNPFGPYQRFGSNNYGILNWFIHKAIVKEPIQIYGEGNQKRDFIYIDDLIDVLKTAIDNTSMHGKIYNVGYGQGISIKDSVGLIKKFIPDTVVEFKPWPDIDKAIETGDYISDISRLKQDANWEPRTSFENGIKQTIEFYAHDSE